MVRLSDLPQEEVEHLLGKNLAPLGPLPWVPKKPLDERRIALITTAGLQFRGDDAFEIVDASYRVQIDSTGTAQPSLLLSVP